MTMQSMKEVYHFNHKNIFEAVQFLDETTTRPIISRDILRRFIRTTKRSINLCTLNIHLKKLVEEGKIKVVGKFGGRNDHFNRYEIVEE